MTDTAIWTTIAGLAVLTYLVRFSFLGLLAGRRLPAWMIRGLSFVPATVLPALTAPMVLRYGSVGAGNGPDTAVLAACLVTLVAGLLTRHVLAGMLAGISGYIVLTIVL